MSPRIKESSNTEAFDLKDGKTEAAKDQDTSESHLTTYR